LPVEFSEDVDFDRIVAWSSPYQVMKLVKQNVGDSFLLPSLPGL